MLTLLTTSERVLELDGEVRVGAIVHLQLSQTINFSSILVKTLPGIRQLPGLRQKCQASDKSEVPILKVSTSVASKAALFLPTAIY